VSRDKVAKATKPEKVKAKEPVKKKGTLSVGIKPPCKIFVDGKPKELSPIRNISLKPGKHIITVVNNDYNFRRRYAVIIKPGGHVNFIKNLMSFIKKQND